MTVKWQLYSDDNGNFYFYNTVTGESAWELPEEAANDDEHQDGDQQVSLSVAEAASAVDGERPVQQAPSVVGPFEIAMAVVETMVALVDQVEHHAINCEERNAGGKKTATKKKRFVSPDAERRFKKNQEKQAKKQKRQLLLARTHYMNLLMPPGETTDKESIKQPSKTTDGSKGRRGALFSADDAFRWRLEKEVEQIRQRYAVRRKRELHKRAVYARVFHQRFLRHFRTQLMSTLIAQIQCSSELLQQRILLLSSPQYAAELERHRKKTMEPELLERYERERQEERETSLKNTQKVFVLVDVTGVGTVHLLQLLFAVFCDEYVIMDVNSKLALADVNI
ncbi:hypothetical protein PINS_up005090 [Pythium insidiosum]|nr:hypothetical protein PINS_up005090 [Pythium insidiosum]